MKIQLRFIATMFAALFFATCILILTTDWSNMSTFALLTTIALWWLCGGISIICFIEAEDAPTR